MAEQNDDMTKPNLGTNSLIRFLDKFAYKRPKGGVPSHGVSIMQSSFTADDKSNIWLTRSKRLSPPESHSGLNSAAFWTKDVSEVPAEDIFFYEYFRQAGKRDQDDNESVAASPEEAGAEEDIWKAMMQTEMPESLDTFDDDSEVGDMDDYSDVSSEDISQSGGSDHSTRRSIASGQAGQFASLDQQGWAGSNPDISPDVKPTDLLGTHLGRITAAGDRKRKARMLKDLPTFASADDYAQLLDDSDGKL